MTSYPAGFVRLSVPGKGVKLRYPRLDRPLLEQFYPKPSQAAISTVFFTITSEPEVASDTYPVCL